MYMHVRRNHSRSIAAAKAGFSASTGARLEADPRLSSQKRQPRGPRRPDSLAAVWASEIVPMLQAALGLRARRHHAGRPRTAGALAAVGTAANARLSRHRCRSSAAPDPSAHQADLLRAARGRRPTGPWSMPARPERFLEAVRAFSFLACRRTASASIGSPPTHADA